MGGSHIKKRMRTIPIQLFAVSYLLLCIGVLVTTPTSATFEDTETLEGDLSTSDSFEEEDEQTDSDDDKEDEDSEAEDNEADSDEDYEEQ